MKAPGFSSERERERSARLGPQTTVGVVVEARSLMSPALRAKVPATPSLSVLEPPVNEMAAFI